MNNPERLSTTNKSERTACEIACFLSRSLNAIEAPAHRFRATGSSPLSYRLNGLGVVTSPPDPCAIHSMVGRPDGLLSSEKQIGELSLSFPSLLLDFYGFLWCG